MLLLSVEKGVSSWQGNIYLIIPKATTTATTTTTTTTTTYRFNLLYHSPSFSSLKSGIKISQGYSLLKCCCWLLDRLGIAFLFYIELLLVAIPLIYLLLLKDFLYLKLFLSLYKDYRQLQVIGNLKRQQIYRYQL